MAVTLLGALTIALSSACGDDDPRPLGSTHPSGVGNYCAQDADCVTGVCYLGPGGGYCTSLCDMEGNDPDCPLDTVCKPIQGAETRCLLICGSQSTCREETCTFEFCPAGSNCVDVDGTVNRACEPNP